jgi:photosystem II stability/assembly factor-like uncharacterized protein
MERFIFLFSLLCLLTFFLHGQQYGWREIARPTTQGLSSVAFTDSLHGVVGTYASPGYFYTVDGGNTWLPGSISLHFVPNAISMGHLQRGWLAGWSGSFAGIAMTTNGGVTWNEQRYVINRQYYGTSAQSSVRNTTTGKNINAFPDTGILVRTTNAGSTWNERTIADTITRLNKVQFVDSLHGWITASYLPSGDFQDKYAILRSVNGGTTWSLHPTPQEFSAFCFLDTLHGWGTSYTFDIFRTTDGGKTWDSMYAYPGDIGTSAISFVDSANGWLFGDRFYQGAIRETIFRTTDGGYNWVEESVGLSEALQDGLMLDRFHGWAVAFDGRVLAYGVMTSVVEQLPGVPISFSLRQNYPNPFNPSTTIEYDIVHGDDVSLTIYDVLGKKVSTVVNQWQEPGRYRVEFDGSSLPSGAYYYTLKTSSLSASKQMLLIK